MMLVIAERGQSNVTDLELKTHNKKITNVEFFPLVLNIMHASIFSRDVCILQASLKTDLKIEKWQ